MTSVPVACMTFTLLPLCLPCRFDPEHEYTLGELLDLNIMAQQEAIAQIATQAVQESALEELFAKKVQAIWTHLEFTLNPYKESKDVFVLGSVEEVTVSFLERSKFCVGNCA